MFSKHFTVETAENGYEALQKVISKSPEMMFDLVVLDINMPISGGIECC